jgi:hypothetical protein
VGSGPFLRADKGYDILLTDFDESYLVEIKSRRAADLFNMEGKAAGSKEMEIKSEKEKSMLHQITKKVDVEGLDKLFLENMDHPVWRHTAEAVSLLLKLCDGLSTCFCYHHGWDRWILKW